MTSGGETGVEMISLENRRHEGCAKKCKTIGFHAMLFTSLLLNGILIVYFLLLNRGFNIDVKVAKDELMCLNNDTLLIGDVTKNEAVYEKLTEVPPADRVPFCKDVGVPTTTVNRTAAFLYLDINKIATPENVIAWTSHIDGTSAKSAFISNMYYKRSSGRIKVVSPGLYFIYSQITLHLEHNVHLEHNIFYQTLVKKGSKQLGVTPLLVGRVSMNSTEVKVSYVSGNFVLDPKDEIFVTVSDKRAVHASGIETYFGIYKISD